MHFPRLFPLPSLISFSSSTQHFHTLEEANFHALATRLKKGDYTDGDIGDLLASENRNQFFHDPIVQRKLFKGVLDGNIQDERVIQALKNCTPQMTEEDQIKISNSSRGAIIRDVSLIQFAEKGFLLRFLNQVPGLQEIISTQILHEFRNANDYIRPTYERQRLGLAKNLRIFTNSDAQRNIASIIRYGEFHNDQAALLEFAKNLDIFTDTTAQRILADSISHRLFGKGPNVLLEVAQHLNIFTDTMAQRMLADSIARRAFRKDPNVLLEVAQHLNIFSDTTAQRILAESIGNGVFGKDPNVLLEVAQHLNIFSDTTAQRILAESIGNGVFGNDPRVRLEIVKNLNCFTTSEARGRIIWLVLYGKLGVDPEVLQMATQHLDKWPLPNEQRLLLKNIILDLSDNTRLDVGENVTVFTDSIMLKVAENLRLFDDPIAEVEIRRGILDGEFGTDSEVLKKVAAYALDKRLFLQPIEKTWLLNAIASGRLGNDLDVLREFRKIINS